MANGKTGKLKVTAVRLVIPLGGAINLTTQLNAMMGALEQQGAIGEVTFPAPDGWVELTPAVATRGYGWQNSGLMASRSRS